MFLNLDRKDPSALAVIDDSGEQLTYGDLCDKAKEFSEALPYRTLIFILAENCNGSLLGYISALSNGIVPLIISSHTDQSLFDALYEKYQPEFLWLPTAKIGDYNLREVIYSTSGYSLTRTGFATPALYEDLSLLLPTSGSTGSPKLVRHSYRNIEANAENVMNLFGQIGRASCRERV